MCAAAYIRCFVRRGGGRKGHALMIGEYKEKKRKEKKFGGEREEEEEERLSSSLFFILSLFLSSFVG